MMLLNAYPFFYIILWMPGIVNRFVEASGQKVAWLAALQATTQYVGLANAITYGFNEHFSKLVWGDIKAWWSRLWR